MRGDPRAVRVYRPAGAVRGAHRASVLRMGRNLLAFPGDADRHVWPEIRGHELRLPLYCAGGGLDPRWAGSRLHKADHRKLVGGIPDRRGARPYHCGTGDHRAAIHAGQTYQGELTTIVRDNVGPAGATRPALPFSYASRCGSMVAGTEGVKMPHRLLGIAALALAGLAAANLAIAGVPRMLADRRANAIPVDVELVIAVDVSYSMDPDEQALQREGYILALTSKEFLQALRQGANGKIAITYFEWAGQFDQKVVMPWRLIDGPEAADAVADEIARAPYRRASRTSISGALRFARPLFDESGYKGLRRVIDVSGDGANNAGPPVQSMRDDVLAAGITINGLPIMLKRPYVGTMDIENLDVYYEDCVIGGPGSFVVPIHEREKFIEATRTKLVLEIAGRQPEGRVVPTSSQAPRISCTVGEKMWQERWGGGIDFQ